jgi:hypothetical protein
MKTLFVSCSLVICASLNSAAQPILLNKKLLGCIEPHEYKRGTRTTLIQIPVLEQSKESLEQGSSPHSSIYHALRNGIALIHSLIEPENNIAHLCTLYDKEDMKKKLSYDSTWRSLIRHNRSDGNYTDKLSLNELESLLGEENIKGTLAGKNIPLAYFEYANPQEPDEKQFEATNVTDSLKAIKAKLDANEDFAALIVVYTDTHTAKDPLLEIIGRDQPHEKVGKEIKKLARNKPLEGHFVSLVMAKQGEKRQYFLLDSAADNGRFLKNRPIKRLLTYLEGPEKGIYLLPKFIPDDSKDSEKDTSCLRELFENYKRSYKKTFAPPVKKHAFFELKSFFLGTLSTISLYACYHYFQKLNRIDQKSAKSSTVSP